MGIAGRPESAGERNGLPLVYDHVEERQKEAA